MTTPSMKNMNGDIEPKSKNTCILYWVYLKIVNKKFIVPEKCLVEPMYQTGISFLIENLIGTQPKTVLNSVTLNVMVFLSSLARNLRFIRISVCER